MDDDPFRAGMVKPNLFHTLKIRSFKHAWTKLQRCSALSAELTLIQCSADGSFCPLPLLCCIIANLFLVRSGKWNSLERVTVVPDVYFYLLFPRRLSSGRSIWIDFPIAAVVRAVWRG